MNLLQESLTRKSEPKLNNFSKSENVLTKFSTAAANGASDANRKAPHPTANATTVQTLVVGSTTTTQSPPKGNGFLLTGPVTDL